MTAKAATHRDWFGLAAFRPVPRFVRGGARCYLLEEVGSTSDFLLAAALALRGGFAPGTAGAGKRARSRGWLR